MIDIDRRLQEEEEVKEEKEEKIDLRVSELEIDDKPLSLISKEFIVKDVKQLKKETTSLANTVRVLLQGAQRADQMSDNMGQLLQASLSGIDVISEILLEKGLISEEEIDKMSTYGTLEPTEEQIKEQEAAMAALEKRKSEVQNGKKSETSK